MLSERSKLWFACIAAASASGWGAWLVRSHYASADALFSVSAGADVKPSMPKCADCTSRAGDDEDTRLIRAELLRAHEQLASLYLPRSVLQQRDLFELMITRRAHPDTHSWFEDDRRAARGGGLAPALSESSLFDSTKCTASRDSRCTSSMEL